MDLVEKMIIKKGSINLSDLQMIKFQIEMDKPSIDYHNKSLTVSPLSSKSIQNYIEQQNRIKNDHLHLWNDSKMNSSKKNNFFAYIINPQKDDKKGKIIIYNILEILDPTYALKHWENKTRNIIVLSHNPIYEGTAVDLFKALNYNDNYRQQNTMKIPEKRNKLLQTYFETIFL